MMRLSSIQWRLGLLFAGFALLIVVSLGGTFFALHSQSQDGRLIHLSSRQRLLVQQLARLALQIERSNSPPDRSDLLASIQTFDATLAALQRSGPVPGLEQPDMLLAPINDGTATRLLDEVAAAWTDLRPQFFLVQSISPDQPGFTAALHVIASQIPAMEQRAEQLVQRYELLAGEKAARLRRFQLGFLAAAAGLLGLSAWVVRRSVLEPVQGLNSSAGLEAHVAQRTRELEALNAVSQEIASNLEVGQVLHSVTHKTKSLLKGDAAFLCLLDEMGANLRLHAASGAGQAVIHHSTAVTHGFASQVLSTSGALRWEAGICQGECQIMAARYRASHLAAPLQRGGRQIGALCIGSQQPAAFSPESEHLLARLANAAALALNNAHLYAQTERTATLEERQRMAGEIHDGMTQTILYLRLMGDRLASQLANGQTTESQQTLQRMRQAIDQAESEARSAIDSLQETFSSAITLQEQLARLVEAAAREGIAGEGIASDWINETPMPFVLPRQETEQIVRVVKEALANAQRHSRASRITVRLYQEHARGVVVVEDQGVGFDLQAAPAEGRQHFGLKIMQARAARLSGQLSIDTQPGKGTRVTLSWPMPIAKGGDN